MPFLSQTAWWIDMHPRLVLLGSFVSSTLSTAGYLVSMVPLILAILVGTVSLTGATYATLRQRHEYLRNKREYLKWLALEYEKKIVKPAEQSNDSGS